MKTKSLVPTFQFFSAVLSLTFLSHASYASCVKDKTIDVPGTATYNGKISEQMFQITLNQMGSDSSGISTRLVVENLDKPITPVKAVSGKGYDALLMSYDFMMTVFSMPAGQPQIVDKVLGNNRVSIVSYDTCGNAVKTVLAEENFTGVFTAEANPPVVENMRVAFYNRTQCRLLADVIDLMPGIDRAEVSRNGVSLGVAQFVRGPAPSNSTGPFPARGTGKLLLEHIHACGKGSANYEIKAYDVNGNLTQVSTTLTP